MYLRVRWLSRRSKPALDMPAHSGEAGVGANIIDLRSFSGQALNTGNRAQFQSPCVYACARAGIGLRLRNGNQQVERMPQFNENELTGAVISSFEQTPDLRVKFL